MRSLSRNGRDRSRSERGRSNSERGRTDEKRSSSKENKKEFRNFIGCKFIDCEKKRKNAKELRTVLWLVTKTKRMIESDQFISRLSQLSQISLK